MQLAFAAAADEERMCRKLPLFAAVLALPFAVADLAHFDIQHPTTQNPIPTRTLDLSGSPNHRYNAYASRVTAPPAINPQQLFGRQAVQTNDARFCAFANGDGASPIYCPRDYSCRYLGPYSAAWGCCNARGCVNAPRTCFDDDDPNNFCRPGVITIDCDSIYTSYLTCTGNKPKCATYIFKSDTLDPQDTNGPASWSCAAAATQVFVYPVAIANADAQVTYTAEPTAAITSPTTTRSTSNPQDDGDDNNNNNNNKKGQLDVGAIIGIVVAVLGVFATIMVGLFPRQMTRCLTCGLRPKKEQSNEEIRKNVWLFLSGRGGPPASQLHIHYHNTPTDQQPLAQGGAPIGLSPITSPGGYHQGYWPQQQAQWGHAGYEQHPPPAYQHQQGYGHGGEYISPGQYAAPQRYEVHEQQRPFLEMEDTGKK
ncbi:hypothetical protein TWF281_005840 [Arthrobotrys megalospora]